MQLATPFSRQALPWFLTKDLLLLLFFLFVLLYPLLLNEISTYKFLKIITLVFNSVTLHNYLLLWIVINIRLLENGKCQTFQDLNYWRNEKDPYIIYKKCTSPRNSKKYTDSVDCLRDFTTPSLNSSARMKLFAVFINGLKPEKGAKHVENFGRWHDAVSGQICSSNVIGFFLLINCIGSWFEFFGSGFFAIFCSNGKV